MCGIAGYIGARPPDPERSAACLGLMGRRGPDHAAEYRHAFSPERQVCLLHSRLSIIDLDPRSHQPFRLRSRVMAFNGELYNYAELRPGLEARGHAFRTGGDTEVLLAALALDGPAGLDACEGMWALALYDEADGSLLLCRDRFGEKPLWLLDEGHGLYFGSEIKFLAALAGRRLEPDLRHLRRFLARGYRSLFAGDGTFFLGVARLPAASCLVVGQEGRSSLRYWSPQPRPDESMTYAQAVEGAREALAEAVRIRLRADVPLAFCMSGGVDSNALIALARRVHGFDVHGFTIAAADERYAEWDQVRQAARELGVRHTAVELDTAGFLDRLRTLVAAHDAPVSTATWYAHWLLMESIAAHGYRIALSGTGADELFAGYFDHHLMYLAAVRQDPERHAAALADWERWVRPVVRNPLLLEADRFVRDPGYRGHLVPAAGAGAALLRQEFSEAFAEEELHPCLLRNRMLNELFRETVPVVLHEDDLNAMYYSLENRSPFLDRRLFDFCFSIPDRHLIRDGYNKKVLRDALAGIVPAPILEERRKVGFNAPLPELLDLGSPAVREAILAPGPVFDLVRRPALEALLGQDRPAEGREAALFAFLGVKFFLEEFA